MYTYKYKYMYIYIYIYIYVYISKYIYIIIIIIKSFIPLKCGTGRAAQRRIMLPPPKHEIYNIGKIVKQ